MLVRSGPGFCISNYRSTLVPFHIGSMFRFFARIHLSWHNTGDDWFWIVYDMCSVSVANTFVHCQTASDYGYHKFGELGRFIYCLLQKIKQGSSLPLVEEWDDYVLPNYSKFAPIADGEFLVGTRVLAALNKIGSSYLEPEFQRDARRFLEEFTTSVLSTVAARSKIGQEVELFVSGDHHRGRRSCATAYAGSSARWFFGSWMGQGQ